MDSGHAHVHAHALQIAKHLPAILRWALGAEHEVRVAAVSFLVSLGPSQERCQPLNARPDLADGMTGGAQRGAARRTVRIEGPLEVPLAGLDVQMREWLRNASTVSATASAGPSCTPCRPGSAAHSIRVCRRVMCPLTSWDWARPIAPLAAADLPVWARTTAPQPCTELDGSPLRDVFTVLAASAAYTPDQFLHVFTLSALHSWLLRLHSDPAYAPGPPAARIGRGFH